MFLGEYFHSLDDKGRITIPRKFRELLEHTCIITRGLDHCLFAYPMHEWKSIEQKLKSLPLSKKEARSFTRFFFSGATEVEFDRQGRVMLPATLKQYAKLEKECAIIGVSNRFEIWNKELWGSYVKESEQSFSDIASEMIDFDF